MIIKKVLNIINEFHDNDMTLGNIEALNLFFRGKKVDSGVIFRDFGIDKILQLKSKYQKDTSNMIWTAPEGN